jgi:hypothetical protein
MSKMAKMAKMEASGAYRRQYAQKMERAVDQVAKPNALAAIGLLPPTLRTAAQYQTGRVQARLMEVAALCERARSSAEMTEAVSEARKASKAAMEEAGMSDDAESAWLAMLAAKAVENATVAADSFTELYAGMSDSASAHR